MSTTELIKLQILYNTTSGQLESITKVSMVGFLPWIHLIEKNPGIKYHIIDKPCQYYLILGNNLLETSIMLLTFWKCECIWNHFTPTWSPCNSLTQDERLVLYPWWSILLTRRKPVYFQRWLWYHINKRNWLSRHAYLWGIWEMKTYRYHI